MNAFGRNDHYKFERTRCVHSFQTTTNTLLVCAWQCNCAVRSFTICAKQTNAAHVPNIATKEISEKNELAITSTLRISKAYMFDHEYNLCCGCSFANALACDNSKRMRNFQTCAFDGFAFENICIGLPGREIPEKEFCPITTPSNDLIGPHVAWNNSCAWIAHYFHVVVSEPVVRAQKQHMT